MTKHCISCIWYSDGFGDDVRGSGWCYSTEIYVDQDSTCPFWEQSLRPEPLKGPDEQLLANVAALDKEVEG